MSMNRVALASVTAALMLSAAPAIAQMQPQRGPDSGGSPQVQGQKEQDTHRQGAEKAEPKAKASKDTAQSKEHPNKSSAQSEQHKGNATANQGIEPKGKGTAEKGAEPKEKATKGTAQKSSEPGEKAGRGTAQKSPEPHEKASKGAARESGGRTQVSEQQRSNVGAALMKDKSVNHVTNVNFSIRIGTRVPRSVHLVALPAGVIAIVPAYRPYRYFVVGDQLCIVDPASYEIVDVIVISNQTAGRSGSGSVALVLSDAERAILVREIDARGGGSTLGLGALTEGAEIPHGITLQVFSGSVVDKVPKLRGYKFFTAENRIVIVDPHTSRIGLVIEDRRR
jgi:hypothetical protein